MTARLARPLVRTAAGLGRATLVPHAVKSIEATHAPGPSRAVRPTLVQLHLWTRPEDVVYLRQIAAERDQTVSAVVRSIVRAYRRSRTAHGVEPARPGHDAGRTTVSGETAWRQFVAN